jgi:hypothetical protein
MMECMRTEIANTLNVCEARIFLFMRSALSPKSLFLNSRSRFFEMVPRSDGSKLANRN